MTDFARALVQLGAPIFRIYRIDGELKLPTGWETTIPGHLAQLNRWREGEGLAMVCGRVFDVIDWDPRNDPDKTGYDAVLKIMPDVYAIVDTPGGGRHFYIKALGLAKKQSIFPGVDYQGGLPDGTGRAFVYLPGTERSHGVYTVLFGPVDMRESDESGEPLRKHIESLRASKKSAPKPVQPVNDARLQRYGASAIRGALESYGKAPAGTGNATLFATLCRVVELENAGVEIDWGHIESDLSVHDYYRRTEFGADGQMHDYETRLASARKTVGDKVAEIPDYQGFTINGQPAEIEVVRPKDAAGAAGPSSPNQTTPDAGRFKITLLSNVKAEEVEWLWDGWIPRRGVTALYGEGGIGKSTYLAHLAGHITRGTAPGALEGQPGFVFVLATEDHYGSVIVPRWTAAGVDMTKAGRIDPVDESGGGLILPDHTEDLQALVAAHGADVVMFDPMISFMHPELSADNKQHVRAVVDPLNAIAQDVGVAFLCLHHINKASGQSTNQRLSGSHAWRDSARAAIAFSQSQDGFIFGQPKNNYGPRKTALSYSIEQRDLEIDGKIYPTSEFVFGGKTDMDINDLFQVPERGRGRPESSTTIAVRSAITNDGPLTLDQLYDRFKLIDRNHLRSLLSKLVSRGEVERGEKGFVPAAP